MLMSKFVRILTFSLVATALVVVLLRSYGSVTRAVEEVKSVSAQVTSVTTQSARKGNGRLHLLVPATSPNTDLCKLLISAQVLGYPTPILINYGDLEDTENAYVQHLAKVEGILNYLQRLSEESDAQDEYAEELVLIVDGYDVWFQLRPDVLIKRYFAVNAEADAKAVELYGEDLVREHDIRQRVVFGPDKLCWPVDFSRPACWAVPQGPLDDTAFGPFSRAHENRDKNEAKWLNSGTVMGTVQDLRDVFQATLDLIHDNHTTDSDQYYFAEIFGAQEYARISRVPALLEKLKSIPYADYEDSMNGTMVRAQPDVQAGRRQEFHIGLDYSSVMFQTFAYWKQHLAWTRVSDSWSPASEQKVNRFDNPRSMSLPEDIQKSLPPFEPFRYGMAAAVAFPSWSEVTLSYNPLTKQFPVLLHFTGSPDEKRFREWWWQKLWFQSSAETLKNASQKLDQREISSESINGRKWYNAEGGDADDIVAKGKSGAWTDTGGWLSWKKLCKSFEEELYRDPGQDHFHPLAGSQESVNA